MKSLLYKAYYLHIVIKNKQTNVMEKIGFFIYFTCFLVLEKTIDFHAEWKKSSFESSFLRIFFLTNWLIYIFNADQKYISFFCLVS